MSHHQWNECFSIYLFHLLPVTVLHEINLLSITTHVTRQKHVGCKSNTSVSSFWSHLIDFQSLSPKQLWKISNFEIHPHAGRKVVLWLHCSNIALHYWSFLFIEPTQMCYCCGQVKWRRTLFSVYFCFSKICSFKCKWKSTVEWFFDFQQLKKMKQKNKQDLLSKMIIKNNKRKQKEYNISFMK